MHGISFQFIINISKITQSWHVFHLVVGPKFKVLFVTAVKAFARRSHLASLISANFES